MKMRPLRGSEKRMIEDAKTEDQVYKQRERAWRKDKMKCPARKTAFLGEETCDLLHLDPCDPRECPRLSS